MITATIPEQKEEEQTAATERKRAATCQHKEQALETAEVGRERKEERGEGQRECSDINDEISQKRPSKPLHTPAACAAARNALASTQPATAHTASRQRSIIIYCVTRNSCEISSKHKGEKRRERREERKKKKKKKGQRKREEAERRCVLLWLHFLLTRATKDKRQTHANECAEVTE